MIKLINNRPLLFFLLIFSTYILFSNGRITSSMDVDVIRSAQNFLQYGSLGAPYKFANSAVYSPHTGLFYVMEGVFVSFSVTLSTWIAEILGFQKQLPVFWTGAFFMALAMMFLYKTFLIFVKPKRAFLYGLVIALGTPILVFSKMQFPEPFVMFAISGAIYFYFNFLQTEARSAVFLLGLFIGLTLICRPDAAIFYLLMFLLSVIKISKIQRNFKINLTYLILGIMIFSLTFIITNYSRFGSITEMGYTINKKQTKKIISKLQEDLTKLKNQINTLQPKVMTAYKNDKNSSENRELFGNYNILVQSFKSKKDYLDKVSHDKNYKTNDIFTDHYNSIVYGFYLILFHPVRSIFFLSPVLLFIFLGIKNNFKNYRLETIIFGMIFLLYLTLFASRAPYGYAGTAAWGVRYMLPMYLFLGLSLVGFDKFLNNSKHSKMIKRIFLLIFIISLGFQIVGSSINYQAIQMPLENIVKTKKGQENIKMARIDLMTSAKASLLVNNWQLLWGQLPSSLKKYLSLEEQQAYADIYNKQRGPNDWFFYDLFTQGNLVKDLNNKSNYKILFMILLGIVVFTVYRLSRQSTSIK